MELLRTILLTLVICKGVFAQIVFTTPANGNAAGTATIPENNAAATKVDDIVTTGGTDPNTYTILSENGDTTSANFKFGFSSAELQTKADATFDFETISSYVVIIQAVDNAGTALTGTATVTVAITDVNEAPMFPAYDFVACVASGAAADTELGTFTIASDPDTTSPNNELATSAYAITGGNTNTEFAVTAATGMVKTTSTATDVTVTSKYELVYTATDNGGTAAIGTATIYVFVDSPACGTSAAITLKGNIVGMAFTFIALIFIHL